MTNDKQKDRLVELLIKGNNQPCGNGSPWEDDYCKGCEYEGKKDCRVLQLADYLLANGVIVPPCKVGDTVWDTEGNAWKVFAITIWQDCIGLKTANNRDIRKTFTIGKHSIGKTVFLTKEEAEEALKGGAE